MKLLENYALQLGQKIDKIYTLEKFFPLPFENFIIITPFSKPSKNYGHWVEVLSLIYPILEKNGIKILQCGGKDEPNLPFCINLQGQTNWGQLQYLISKSKLLLSTDTAAAHLAGHYNKPLVVLITNNFSKVVAPYFGDKNIQIIHEPDRTNRNPSFTLDEGENKQINEIKPEEIAKSVIKLLGEKLDYTYKTLQIGRAYNVRTIEAIPDQVVDFTKLGVNSLIVRMDYLFDEQNLFNQLHVGKCQIVTDRFINPELLKAARGNIAEVIYNIKSDSAPNPDFCKLLFNMKIPYKLMTYEDKIDKFKLKFMDWGLIHKLGADKPNFFDEKDLSKYIIKSNKFLLSNQKVFQSYYHYKNNLPISTLVPQFQEINNKNLEDLWKEIDYLYFLEKI